MTIALVSVLTLLTLSSPSKAFDSTDAYNTITFSYRDNTFVSQQFVLSDDQKTTANQFTLIVDAKDGGGRPTHNLDGTCASYCSQYDTAGIKINAYNSSGQMIASKTVTQGLMNYGSSSNPGWSIAPGDNQHDWTQMSVSMSKDDVGGNFSAVDRLEVQLINTNEGSFWAGNYGVQFRTPTLQKDSSETNLLYNAEFGVDSNGVKVQGWSASYSSYSSCGVTSGSNICATEEQTVTANMWGGGEDPNGGTTSSQPGGYDATLTSDNADEAAEGEGGGTTQPPAPTCGGSSDSSLTCDQATKSDLQYYDNHAGRKSDWEDIDTGTENIVRIEQIGDGNILEIDQTMGWTGGGNLVMGRSTTDDTATIIGDYNSVDLYQYGNDNVIGLDVAGDNNEVSGLQSGNGMRMRLIVEGDGNYASAMQFGNNNREQGQGHFADIKQSGDDNLASTYQWDENQLLVVDVNANNTTVLVDQQDGENYSSTVVGNDHTYVDLDQRGGGDHGANINLTGTSNSNLTLTQDSSTTQLIDVTQHCVTANGCSVTVTQY